MTDREKRQALIENHNSVQGNVSASLSLHLKKAYSHLYTVLVKSLNP